MKVLFVIKGLVVEGGGAERVFTEIANAFHNQGHDVIVTTFDHAGHSLFYSLSEDIPLHELGITGPTQSFSWNSLPRISWQLRKLVRQLNPDCVVAFMHSSYVPVALSLIGTGVPLVASEHTAAAHFADKPVQAMLSRWAQRRAFAKTVVSEVVFNEHAPSLRSNLYIVPNPVDFSAFEKARKRSLDAKVILCVGGFRKEKDQKTLIDAFDFVANDFPDWHLRFVGDGIERSHVEERVAASPFSDRIELAGIIRDVAGEYAKASIVAMPSRYEAMPMVAIEAMASGRPVIGFSDCAGARALISHEKNGLLVYPEDNRGKALAESLSRLMGNRELRKSIGAYAPSTVKQYSLVSIMDQWERLLQDAASVR